MVAATLGLGLGASAAMFGIVDRLMLRGPTHVERAGELRRIYVSIPDRVGGYRTTATHPFALYRVLRNQAHAFSAVAAYIPSSVRAGRGPDAPRVSINYATTDYWSALGVHPLLGRLFSTDEDGRHERDPVVLSFGFWQRQYAGDPGVIGRPISLGGRPRTVIGITPRGFTGAEWTAVDAWVPVGSEDRAAGWETSWDANYVRIIGRLRAGVLESVAGSEGERLLHGAFTGSNAAMREAQLFARPLSYDDQGAQSPELEVARLLLGVAIVVMFISAANAANLLLARGVRQRRELAIRIAVGAGRARLIGMLFTQASMLAALGGATGVAVAYTGGQLARTLLFPGVAWDGVPVDGRMITYLAALVCVAAIMIGMIAAVPISRMSAGSLLGTGSTGSGTTAGSEQRRVRSALQVVQVAMSLVLLVVAGLFVRSLMAIDKLDLGVRYEHVLSGSIVLPSTESSNRERQEWLDLLERVRAVPGVGGAAIAVGSPFGNRMQISLRVSGRDSVFGLQESGPFIYAVTPGYFDTMGTPVRRGRSFDAADREGSEPVAIVNETMARWVWPGHDPVGQCVYLLGISGAPCSRVVGVVSDARQSKIREDPVMQYYVPYGQEVGIGGNLLLVRVAPRIPPEAFVATLRAEILKAKPWALAITVETLASYVEPQTRPWRMGARMFALFGGLALIVTSVGLFGLVSYLVSQRKRELAVRLSLGANTAQIARLVLVRSLGTTALGSLVGCAVTYTVAPFIQPYLFVNSARDWQVVVAATAAVAIAALFATVVPIVRACRVNPVVALRTE